MKKNRKLLFGLFVFFFAFIFSLDSIKAACLVSVSSPKSAIVGSTFKVTTSVSSDVGSWYYVLSYDASKVKLISGSTKVVGVIGDSKTNTYTFKALSSGTTSFRATNVSLASNATNQQCSATAGSSSISIKTQAEIEASYSRNNNLSSLSVEGAQLSPEFNKNVLEYTATLPVDTTKANVLATTEDKTASVIGAGQIDVVDGINKIEIIVTAQHGEKKTYVINLTVEELDPIEVKVNNKKYTIVRKKGQVENIPTGFIEDKITIENQEVVSYKSDITKINLVALKDEEGNIKLFIYDLENKKFEEFYEAKASGLNLIILNDIDNIPFDFIKTTFDYNGVKIDGYKFKDDKENRYFLVYAQNLENASKEFYLYDNKEGTFQRYFDDIVNIKNNSIKIRDYIIIGFISLFSLIILIKIFKLFSSKENKIKKYQRKIEKLKNKLDDSYDISKVDIKEEPVIRQIDEDEYIVPKKSRKQKIKEIEEAKRKLDDSKPSYKRVSLDEDDFDD